MKHPQLDQIPKADYGSLETRLLGHLIHQGVAVTQMSQYQARQLGKSIHYMVVDDFFRMVSHKGKRSLRNRHHKAKPQPNHGPRKLNQW